MNNDPKPLIEEHWHIQNLIKAQEERVAERQYTRDQAKIKALREDIINDTKAFDLKEFYCTKCQEDFVRPSQLHIETDWTNTDQHIAFYRTKHYCGTWTIRHVTDKLSDGYWSKSKVVARDRGKHSIDLLQPFENNYQLVYGKK